MLPFLPGSQAPAPIQEANVASGNAGDQEMVPVVDLSMTDEKAATVLDKPSPESEPHQPLTPTVSEFSSKGSELAKTIETPPHPWKPRQLEEADAGETGVAPTATETTEQKIEDDVENEDLELSKKVLLSEFNTVADMSCAQAAKSGHNPLPEMMDCCSPSLRDLANLKDGQVSRQDQNVVRQKVSKRQKKDKTQEEAQGSQDEDAEGEPEDGFGHLSPGLEDQPKKRKPRAKGKAKAKAKAKTANAKAKAKTTKAKAKATPKAKTTKGKDVKAVDKKPKQSKKPEPDSPASATKGSEAPASSKGPVKRRPASSAKAKSKAVEPASFARRYMPKNEDGAAWWTALRTAFNQIIKQHVKTPSKLEDYSSGTCSDSSGLSLDQNK